MKYAQDSQSGHVVTTRSVVLGDKAAEKLCAVEGVEFSDEAQARYAQLNSQNLTAEQRRSVIIDHYKALAANQ